VAMSAMSAPDAQGDASEMDCQNKHQSLKCDPASATHHSSSEQQTSPSPPPQLRHATSINVQSPRAASGRSALGSTPRKQAVVLLVAMLAGLTGGLLGLGGGTVMGEHPPKIWLQIWGCWCAEATSIESCCLKTFWWLQACMMLICCSPSAPSCSLASSLPSPVFHHCNQALAHPCCAAPLLLQIGVQPQVASATSSLMVLFSSSAALVSYGVLGRINLVRT
jgi:hypothetical protein